MNKWINGEEHTVKITREDGLKIGIPIPALEAGQTKIELESLVIRYEE